MVSITKVLWNNKLVISLERVEWFCWFFACSYFESCISIEATKVCYIGLALSGIGSQPNRLSDVLNLKNLKTIWGIKLIYCFHWNYKKYHAILGYAAKYFWPIRFFPFDLFDLLILIPGVHCYIVLVLYYS